MKTTEKQEKEFMYHYHLLESQDNRRILTEWESAQIRYHLEYHRRSAQYVWYLEEARQCVFLEVGDRVLVIRETLKYILKGIELERCEAALCEPAGLTVSAKDDACCAVWEDLPARGSLARSLHGDGVHQIVLVPCLRDFVGRCILITGVPEYRR
jgi:hypothetical protein